MSTGFMIVSTVLWVVVVFQFLVSVGLLREVKGLRGLPDPERLPVGARAPAFAGTDVDTGERISGKNYTGKALGILLVSPECRTCVQLLESFDQVSETLPSPLLIACTKNDADCRKLLRRPVAGVRFLSKTNNDVRQLFGVTGSPAAILIDAEGRIGGYDYPADATDLFRFLSSPDAVAAGASGGSR